MATFQTGRSTRSIGFQRQRRHERSTTTLVEHISEPDSLPQVSYEMLGPSLFPESAKPPASFYLPRPCYIFCFLMFLIVAGSASLGIYYTVRYDKMGDGFTAAGWIVATGTLLLAGPLARHYPNCSCWGTKRSFSYEFIRMDHLPHSLSASTPPRYSLTSAHAARQHPIST